MAEIKDGGSAFPSERVRWETDHTGKIVERPHPGMSLRDWFAGQALAGIVGCARDYRGINNRKDVAKLAYDFADAMLAARGGSNG